jgi:hypothetical protein
VVGSMQAIENLSLKQMLVIRADGVCLEGGDVSSGAVQCWRGPGGPSARERGA